jgi:hypothetical protein
MVSNKQHESTLIESFVASFEKLDEMSVVGKDLDVIGWKLAGGEPDEYAKSWRPIKVETPTGRWKRFTPNCQLGFRAYMKNLCLLIDGRK